MALIPKKEIDIDDVPLGFGKHKGKTPNELYKAEEFSYICWLYEECEGDHVSEELYDEAMIEKEFHREDSPSW